LMRFRQACGSVLVTTRGAFVDFCADERNREGAGRDGAYRAPEGRSGGRIQRFGGCFTLRGTVIYLM